MDNWSHGIGVLNEQDLAFLDVCKRMSGLLCNSEIISQTDIADNLLKVNDYLQKYGVPSTLKEDLEKDEIIKTALKNMQ